MQVLDAAYDFRSTYCSSLEYTSAIHMELLT